MKTLEKFYYLLWYAYAKAYLKIWGRLGSFDVDSKGSSFLITWFGLVFMLPVVFFLSINNYTIPRSLLSFFAIIILLLSIYCFNKGRNKANWEFYKNEFDNWLALNRKRNKKLLLLLLITPLFTLLFCFLVLIFRKQ